MNLSIKLHRVVVRQPHKSDTFSSLSLKLSCTKCISRCHKTIPHETSKKIIIILELHSKWVINSIISSFNCRSHIQFIMAIVLSASSHRHSRAHSHKYTYSALHSSNKEKSLIHLSNECGKKVMQSDVFYFHYYFIICAPYLRSRNLFRCLRLCRAHLFTMYLSFSHISANKNKRWRQVAYFPDVSNYFLSGMTLANYSVVLMLFITTFAHR